MSSLIAIVSFGCISQAAANCATISTGNWSNCIWDCGHVPTVTDVTYIEGNVTLDQAATVNSIELISSGGPTGVLNTGNFTITLSNPFPINISAGAFNADTSTVQLSDADHTINPYITFYNLQWATALTAPRTLTINGAITKAAGGTFNLDGTATNKVSFTGTGSINPAIVVNNCASSTLTGVTCAASGGGAVSAPINLNFNKPVETYSTDIELK